MRRTVLRMLAIAVILVQVIQLSGGLLCGRRHSQQDQDCGSMTSSTQAALATSTHDASSGSCTLLGPCAAPIPAVASTGIATDIVPAVAQEPARHSPSRPASFTSAPIPPPPQA